MAIPIKVTTYRWMGIPFISADTDIPLSAIPANFFTSGVVSGSSTDQNYAYYLSGTNYP